MPNSRLTVVFAAFLLSLVLFYPIVSNASNTIVVTSTEDIVNATDDVVTLREAMTIAHTGGVTENGERIDGNKKVNIDLSQISGTILLTSRLPRIDKDLEIYGDPSLNLAIDGNHKYRIFFVYKGSLTLSNLILQHGFGRGGHGQRGQARPGGGGGGMGGALFVNKYSEAACINIQFATNTAQGGNGGGERAPNASGSGGGFYGSGMTNNGGSGGYLGDEGKGGAITDENRADANGGFGGGGGLYRKNHSGPDVWGVTYHGGNGGFGGGAGCGNDSDGVPGAFGGGTSFYWGSFKAGGGAGLGGAVFVREFGTFSAKECTFINNSAIGGIGTKTTYPRFNGENGQGKAGAIFIHNKNARASLYACTFNGNNAQDSSGEFVLSGAFQNNNDVYGYFNIIYTQAISMNAAQYPPATDTDILFRLAFSHDVTGVDATDFDIDSDDPADTQITSIKEVDAHTYLITVTHSRSTGYVTLKLNDDDSIHDALTEIPLGNIGEGNGNFTGETCYFFETRRIDSILPLSGTLKEYGGKIRNGLELAVTERNKVNSPDTRVWLASNSLDNQSATATAEALVADAGSDENVLALLGGAVSSNTLYMADLCQTNQIPLFSPTSTSTELADKDYTIKPVPLDNYQVKAIHQILKKYALITRNKNEEDWELNTAIVAEDSEYGRGFLELGNEEYITLTGQYIFPSNSLDTEEAVRFISDLYSTNSVEAVVLAVYEDDAIALLEALERYNRELLTSITYIFTDSAATQTAIDYRFLPSNLAFFGVRPIIPDTPTAKSFANSYKAGYGSEPEWFSYYAYDAVMALNEALINCAEITRQGIWNAVPWMRFEGLTGSKTFDEKGNLYSAAYDLLYIVSREWEKIETIHVFKPEDESASGLAKAASRNPQPLNASVDFTYTLPAADPLISHLAGEETETGWTAQSLDASLGGVLMAYYEDIERGLSNEGEVFVFEDGVTYYLTFNVFRIDQTEDAPTEGDVLEITAKSVYRYQNGDGVTHFARTELVNQTASMADWPSGTSKQITIPVAYVSAAPNGTEVNNKDNRFHWELKLLNAAKQQMLLTSVEIGTSVPTGIGDYMLY